MTVAYEDFLTEVLPYGTDINEPAALRAIRNACIEFCERTLIWQADFVLDLDAGVSQYVIPAPLDSRRAAIVALWVNGVKYQPTSTDRVNSRTILDWRQQDGLNPWYTETPELKLQLVGRPTIGEAGGIRGVQALSPTRDSVDLGADVVYERWAKAIAAGALAELYNQMGAPYYNPQMATQSAIVFKAMTAKAQAEVNNGNGRGVTRVAMRPFARGRYPWA